MQGYSIEKYLIGNSASAHETDDSVGEVRIDSHSGGDGQRHSGD